MFNLNNGDGYYKCLTEMTLFVFLKYKANLIIVAKISHNSIIKNV